MLLAVEGGGFFSSSASGYSKGLTLLFLDKKDKEKHMKVSPWNQYHLVDQDFDPSDLQLASVKNRISRGCASCVCFGVGHVQHQDILTERTVSNKGNCNNIDCADVQSNETSTVLKSSLKTPSNGILASIEDNHELNSINEKGCDISVYIEKRKLQWTDACGSELVEIREYEPSEVEGSDDEFGNGTERSCACTIM